MFECFLLVPNVCCEVDLLVSPDAKKWLQTSGRVISEQRRIGLDTVPCSQLPEGKQPTSDIS